MNLLNSRPIIYFTIGLILGASLGYVFEFYAKADIAVEPQLLKRLLNLLLYLTIWGVILGGLTVLLSRGLALVFLEETKKPKTIRKGKA